MSDKDPCNFVEEREIPIRMLEFDGAKRHDEGHIARIAESIALTGLINPIVVHAIDQNRWRVEAGEGRIQAHIKLGKKTIRARIYKDDHLFNRLRHIDENIARVEVDSFQWDRLVTERIEIVKQLDPDNRAIQKTKRRPRSKRPVLNDNEGLGELSAAKFAAERVRQTPEIREVATELGCSPRKVRQAKARVERATESVAKAHATGELKTYQVDELIKIEDPVVQAATATAVIGKTADETKQIVGEVVKTPSERLDAEMNAAVKIASALTSRLQTIKRLMEIEGLTPSDVIQARYFDVVLGLKQWL